MDGKISPDEFRQEALLAMLGLVNGYEPRLGSFESHCYTRINGAMIDLKRSYSADHGLGRETRSRLLDAAKARDSSAKLHEIVTKRKGSLYLLQFIVRIDDDYMILPEPTALNAEIDPGNSTITRLDLVASKHSVEQEVIPDDDPRLEVIADLIWRLPERSQVLLEMYFGLAGNEPISLREIGEIFGVTESRVSQILTKSLADLRDAYHAENA